ncbi:MAG: hypothetical protein WC401_03565 [Bacteroidales bacterium]|jgi:hypothetical protein
MAAPIGNKYSQEWTLENALPRFEDALKFAQDDDNCLCLQDAIIHSGIPNRTFYYLADNQEVLQTIKQDIHDVIISRINRLAIRDIAPASPAIFRMKNLGEIDEQHIVQKGSMKQEITVTSKEAAEELEKLKDKFDKE